MVLFSWLFSTFFELHKIYEKNPPTQRLRSTAIQNISKNIFSNIFSTGLVWCLESLSRILFSIYIMLPYFLSLNAPLVSGLAILPKDYERTGKTAGFILLTIFSVKIATRNSGIFVLLKKELLKELRKSKL